ncbi:hypothetical protein J2X61_002724 [Bacillus sp. 3255]|nr:hypothetical protein [Bacillus sp. 3255]
MKKSTVRFVLVAVLLTLVVGTFYEVNCFLNY